jgi:2-C-methyl-D-erythritol 4-phosphate cytidylyltransferase/2-C-methyl-D-erythritol 2,4-cyclodiphosphate synthase
MSKIIALITACGRGSRLNSKDGIPKQYLNLAGIPILRHSILAFLNNKNIDDVICVIHPDDHKLYEEAIIGLDLLNPVFGGETRQESIRIGLQALEEYDPDKVLIHDGVRPFVSKKIINGIIEQLEIHPAVIPAIIVEDTIKKCDDGKIEWTVERDNLWRAQTPQGFIYRDILNSHIAFRDLNFTDDASLNEYAGIPVAIIPGSQNNFKITNNEDYERAQKISSLFVNNVRYESRVGIGFDVHEFCNFGEGEEHFIKICGIKIAHTEKIKAHSDGDVAIHSIMDAILGAIGEGDIGEHFPPSDNRWKNIDSCEMLKIVNKLLKKKGGRIINLDLVIMAEAPKINNYKGAMKQKISDIIGIDEKLVNIKATTTEKLGFIGRKEGLAAQAIANIVITNIEEELI